MARGIARAQEKIERRPDYHPVRWRDEASTVTAIKRAYREATRVQRAQLRGWMRRVLSGADSDR